MTFDRRQVVQAGLAACACLPSLSARVSAQEVANVRFSGSAAVPRPDQAFMFAGITNGFYKDLGIKGDFVTVAGSAANIQLVVAQQSQVAHIGLLELLAAKHKNPNLPVKAVYLHDVKNAYEVVVPEESPIKSVAELKDKKVGVISLASGSIPTLRAMLHHAGVNSASVEVLPVGAGAQALAALRSDRVQALSLFRGSHAAIENLGVRLRYFTPDIPSGVLIANSNDIEKNRGVIVRALRGVIMNTVYAQTNPAAAVRSFWSIFGKPTGNEDQELAASSRLVMRAAELWKPLGSPGRYGDMNDKMWMDMLDFMGPHLEFDRSQIKNVYTADLIPEINQVNLQSAIDAAKAEKK